MIVFSLFMKDLIFHFAVLVLISAYLRFLITDRTNNYIWIALVAAAIITYINHMYYPMFRMPMIVYKEGGSAAGVGTGSRA